MSCLSKLANNPVLPQLPKQLQAITPSVLQNFSLKTQISNVNAAFQNSANSIKTLVTGVVNNALGQITGKLPISLKQVQSLSTSFKSLPQLFLNKFNGISSLLSKEYAAVNAFINCEIGSISDSFTQLVETVNLQASINQAANSVSVSGITNSVAKTLSEDVNQLNSFIGNATNSAISSASSFALSSVSNSATVAAHNSTMSSLQNLSLNC